MRRSAQDPSGCAQDPCRSAPGPADSEAYTFHNNGIDMSGTVIHFKFEVTTGYSSNADMDVIFPIAGTSQAVCGTSGPPTAAGQRLEARNSVNG